MPDQQATHGSTHGALPPPTSPTPPGSPTPQGDDVRLIDPPRAGELATGWRIVTACLWISVIVALAAVWSASAQLGLSTWWLGPRADPRSPIIRLSPFVAPLIMTIAAFNHVRRLPWFGVGAAAVTAVFGIVDLGRATGLATVELLIAGTALVVSVASSTGVYRAAPDRGDEPVR